MEHALLTIGCHFSEEGETYLTADGKIAGTISQVREFLDRYEATAADRQFSARVIAAVRQAQARRVL